jgi:hypothetical protein
MALQQPIRSSVTIPIYQNANTGDISSVIARAASLEGDPGNGQGLLTGSRQTDFRVHHEVRPVRRPGVKPPRVISRLSRSRRHLDAAGNLGQDHRGSERKRRCDNGRQAD